MLAGDGGKTWRKNLKENNGVLKKSAKNPAFLKKMRKIIAFLPTRQTLYWMLQCAKFDHICASYVRFDLMMTSNSVKAKFEAFNGRNYVFTLSKNTTLKTKLLLSANNAYLLQLFST
jgi:hypothetical protein